MTARRHVILGGTAGLGLAAARILAAEGCRVAIVGRDAARARVVAAGFGGFGEGCDDGGPQAALERAVDWLGGIDGLAVTAGPIASRGDPLALSDAAWAEMFDSQVMTVIRALRVAIPAMRQGGGGAIVTCAAYSIRAPKEALLHYAAMKAAIAVITKGVAKAHGEAGVRANCIAPGAMATEAFDAMRADMAEPDNAALWRALRDRYHMHAALDRIGEPHEAGELIAFLLSEKAAYLTGALINIDGGTDF